MTSSTKEDLTRWYLSACDLPDNAVKPLALAMGI